MFLWNDIVPTLITSFGVFGDWLEEGMEKWKNVCYFTSSSFREHRLIISSCAPVVEQPGSSGTRLRNTACVLRGSAWNNLHLEAISSRICHQKVSQKHRNQGSAEEETQAVEEPQHANPTSLYRIGNWDRCRDQWLCTARTRSEILSAKPMVGCNLQDNIGTHPICPHVFPWFQKQYFHDRSMTDAEILWALHKRSQANMSPANSAMAMISISMAGEVQSPSTSAKILGSTKCFKYLQVTVPVTCQWFSMGSLSAWFLPDSILGCWIKTISCPKQCTATSILLRQMVGVLSCILTAKHSQNAVFRCCFVDKKGSRHHARKTVVEGSFMIIRKANLSPNKTCLQDNTAYFELYIWRDHLRLVGTKKLEAYSAGDLRWPSTQPSFCVNASVSAEIHIINSASASVTFRPSKSHVLKGIQTQRMQFCCSLVFEGK